MGGVGGEEGAGEETGGQPVVDMEGEARADNGGGADEEGGSKDGGDGGGGGGGGGDGGGGDGGGRVGMGGGI